MNCLLLNNFSPSQVSAMIQQFDDDIADEPDDLDDPDDLDLDEVMSGDDFDVDDELEPEPIEITPPRKDKAAKRGPPPALISIADISSYSTGNAPSDDENVEEEPANEKERSNCEDRLQFQCQAKVRKRPIPGTFPPALSVRNTFVRP